MIELNNKKTNLIILFAIFFTTLVSFLDINSPNYNTTKEFYIISRFFFVSMMMLLLFLKKLKNELRVTGIIYVLTLYGVFYQITLANTYLFVYMQLLYLLNFVFIFDPKYFKLNFWPATILNLLALIFSKEVATMSPGGSLKADFFSIGLVCASFVYVTHKVFAKKQLEQYEKLQRLAIVGMNSSFFMHEMKSLAKDNPRVQNILNTFYTESKTDVVNIRSSIDEIIKNKARQIESFGITVLNEVDPSLSCQFNSHQFHLVIENLFKNAFEHMLAHNLSGAIEFKSKGNTLIISNPLAGKLDPSVIFEPFYSTKLVQEASGLGLPLVKNFCEKNNATISASIAEGRILFVISF